MKNDAVERSPRSHPTTVLVADDHELVRDGIKMLVASMWGDVRFVEADDGESLLRAAVLHSTVQLAFVDLNMPGMRDGLLLIELARRHPNIPLVVISAFTSPDLVRRTMDVAAVRAFVPKSASVDGLRMAIEAAMQGRKLGFLQADRGTANTATRALTPRQEQIRGLLRQGMSNKLIASTLGISEGTVKNHLSDIFRTLNATNRTQAAQINFGVE